jgi:putative PEP-CTERM system TPR-repeat lipoprotein
LQFEAVLALQKGNAKRTQELCQQLLRSQPENPLLLMLAGQAELKLGTLSKAEALFAKALQLTPQGSAPRLLLAEAYLRGGQTEKALASLKPLLDDKAGNAEALSLAGLVQLLAGDAKAAEASLLRAARLKPADSRIRVAAALTQLGKGRDNEVFADLEVLASTDSGNIVDLALFNAQRRRNDFDGALKALDALDAKQTGQALPDYLRGRVALQRRDPVLARKHFEAALAKQADYFPALSSLAALDAKAGRPDAARARLEAALQSDPGNNQALMMLAVLGARSGASPQDVGTLLQDAVKALPGDAGTHGALIDHYRAAGDKVKALSAAQAAVAALPDDPGLLDRLGQLQQDSGDINLALVSFTRMASLQPTSALPLLRLADAQLAVRKADAAASSVQRAMEIEPRSLLAQRAGVIVALRRKQPAQALAIARTVQTQRPNEAVGWMLEAEIELAQGHSDGAVAVYRKALAKADANEAALQLHALLLKTRQIDEADLLAERWMKDHPRDAVFLSRLGTAALAEGQPALAEAHFREVLRLLPENPLALNNLAFALLKQKKPGAVAIAESAVKLLPNQAALQDTLAQAYAAENQLDKAIRTQSKAVEMAPQDPAMRLTLAKLNLRSGAKDDAHAELDKLALLGDVFPGQAEVQGLRKQGLPVPDQAQVSPAGVAARTRPSTSWKQPRTWFKPAHLTKAANAAQVAGAVLALGLLLAPLIAALRPKFFVVKRSTVVDAPAQRVFDRLQDLRQWERWSAWPQFSAAMKRGFNPTTAGRGAYCTWQDKRRDAQGSVEILSLTAPDKLVVDLAFARPDEAHHVFEFTLSAAPAGGTWVSCVARGPAPFWLRLRSLLGGIDRHIGKPLQLNLAHLKAAAEAVPDAHQDPARQGALAAAT